MLIALGISWDGRREVLGVELTPGKHMKSTNMLERLNQEIKRRTHVVRIFPNEAACLRLVRALAVEIHEDWQEDTRYLNMEELKEHRKQALPGLSLAVA